MLREFLRKFVACGANPGKFRQRLYFWQTHKSVICNVILTHRYPLLVYFVLLLLYLGIGTLAVPVAEDKVFLIPGKPYVFGRPVCSAGTELFGRRFGGGLY